MRGACTVWFVASAVACSPPEPPPSEEDTETADSDPQGTPRAFVDAHIHQMPGQSASEVLSLAQEAGVDGVVLLGVVNGPDDAGENTASFVYVPDLEDIDIAAIEADLIAGSSGIGELSIRHQATPSMQETDYAADQPAFLALYDLAQQYGVALNVHFEFELGRMESFAAALDYAPDVGFVWAHAGDTTPDNVRPLLDAHANLHVDLSCRNPHFDRGFDVELQSIADSNGTLDASWRELIEDHTDRFLVGTDVGPPGRAEKLDEVVQFYEALFDQVAPEVADALANGNARRVYGLSFGG